MREEQMPAQRLSMRQVREVLRRKWACGLSDRKMAQSLRVSRPTVAEYVRRAQAAGLSWPLPDTLDETLFVDYAGQTMPVVNPLTGEVHAAAIFIAVLGASNSTFAEATWSQSLPDWIGSHVRAFAALGGVPQILVPDTLKAAVSRGHRYEPTLNRTYLDLAQHYDVAVIPARAARPRDKAKVEVGVQVVERWIL